MVGIEPVQRPYEGCLSYGFRLAGIQGQAKRRPIETLGRRSAGSFVVLSSKRVRGGWVKSWPRSSWYALEGGTPRESSDGADAKPIGVRSDLLAR
jgi:hypothetical protein